MRLKIGLKQSNLQQPQEDDDYGMRLQEELNSHRSEVAIMHRRILSGPPNRVNMESAKSLTRRSNSIQGTQNMSEGNELVDQMGNPVLKKSFVGTRNFHMKSEVVYTDKPVDGYDAATSNSK